MHKRCLCPSVCLASFTFVYCVETAKDTVIVATECEQKNRTYAFEWYHFQ